MTVSEVQQGQEPTAETLVVEAETQNEEPKTFTAEYVAELRKEAAKHRKEAQALKQAAEAAETAKLSDVERLTKQVETLQKERDDLTTRQKQQIIRAEIEKAAGKVGVDMELAGALLPTDDLDVDDESAGKEIEKRMRALLAKYPVLAKAPTLSPTNGGTTGNKQAVIYTTSQLKDHAFYQKHKADIMVAAREGRIVDE